MTKRLIVIACGTALLIAVVVGAVVALRNRQQPAPPPDVPGQKGSDPFYIPGYDDYIFTGYKRSVGDVHHYPANHLIVPSCKNRHKTSTYYIPIGKPYWTENP